MVVPQTTQFTTGIGPDTTQPLVVRSNPFTGAVDVPINAAISLEVDEPIDFSTVNSTSFNVWDNTTGQNVAGSFSFSDDGRIVSFVPDQPLSVGRSHSVSFSHGGMLDLAGNHLTGSSISFTTSFDTDTTPPLLVGVSPEDGQGDVSINTSIVVEFDEPVQSTTIGQLSLSSGSVNIAVIKRLSNGNRTVVITPLSLLEAFDRTYGHSARCERYWR